MWWEMCCGGPHSTQGNKRWSDKPWGGNTLYVSDVMLLLWKHTRGERGPLLLLLHLHLHHHHQKGGSRAIGVMGSSGSMGHWLLGSTTLVMGACIITTFWVKYDPVTKSQWVWACLLREPCWGGRFLCWLYNRPTGPTRCHLL